MKTYQIIDFLANSNECKEIWQPLRRYFRIADNYLKGNTLSVIEPKNHSHNPPRKCYLEKIASGFNLKIDFNSPLFEGKLNDTYGEMFYRGNSFAIPRFFRRLEEAHRANLNFNEEVIKDLLMMGDVLFKNKYPQCIPLDP